MKNTIALLFLICLAGLEKLTACTTFLINSNGQLVFGRNYDWVSDAGMVCTNLAGLNKTSLPMPDGATASWISKYGSITFNQYGKEFPTGGMNEKGLVVELMWEDQINYPQPDDRPALSVLQWLQYQLDNNATVEEVLSTDKKIRISANNPPLHYLVADASGNVATIEFYNGKMELHAGNQLPFAVLTNSPYSESAQMIAPANALTDSNFAFQNNSIQRFAKACAMVQQYQAKNINIPVIDYAFDILDKVSQQNFTKWSIVYDLKNKKIHFKTYRFSDIKYCSFAGFSFACNATSKALNMNQPMQGNIDKLFVSFSEELNTSVIRKAVLESKNNVNIPEERVKELIAYTKNIKCAG